MTEVGFSGAKFEFESCAQSERRNGCSSHLVKDFSGGSLEEQGRHRRLFVVTSSSGFRKSFCSCWGAVRRRFIEENLYGNFYFKKSRSLESQKTLEDSEFELDAFWTIEWDCRRDCSWCDGRFDGTKFWIFVAVNFTVVLLNRSVFNSVKIRVWSFSRVNVLSGREWRCRRVGLNGTRV